MTKRQRKTLLTAAKILVAGALLALVMGQVHWADYVTFTRDDESQESLKFVEAVGPEGAPAVLRVRESTWFSESKILERDIAQVVPVEGATGLAKYVRPGFKTSIMGMKIPLALAAVGAFLLAQLAVSIRWWLLLKVQDVYLTLGEAIRLTLLGIFFNNAVPGTVGGDLFKAYYAAKHTERKAAVMVTVAVDRVIGLVEFALMASFMLVVAWSLKLAPAAELKFPAIAVAVLLSCLLLAMAFLLSGRFRRFFHVQKLYGRLPIAHHIADAGEATGRFRRRPGKLIEALGISFAAHAAFVFAALLIGKSLGIPVPWHKYYLYIPLIYVIAAVPITPGGLGVVEKLYVVFLAANPSALLVLALIMRLLPILVGLPGLMFFLAGPRPPKAATIRHELDMDEDEDEPETA
jgi:glycosyltransferase 2 family protein